MPRAKHNTIKQKPARRLTQRPSDESQYRIHYIDREEIQAVDDDNNLLLVFAIFFLYLLLSHHAPNLTALLYLVSRSHIAFFPLFFVMEWGNNTFKAFDTLSCDKTTENVGKMCNNVKNKISCDAAESVELWKW